VAARARPTLNYRPCVERITSTVGWTSGNQDVPVVGYGFAGWEAGLNNVSWPQFTPAEAYICMFGNYLGTLKTGTAAFGGLTCVTPQTTIKPDTTSNSITPGGAEFNTDVYVSIQLYNAPITTAPTR